MYPFHQWKQVTNQVNLSARETNRLCTKGVIDRDKKGESEKEKRDKREIEGTTAKREKEKNKDEKRENEGKKGRSENKKKKREEEMTKTRRGK